MSSYHECHPSESGGVVPAVLFSAPKKAPSLVGGAKKTAGPMSRHGRWHRLSGQRFSQRHRRACQCLCIAGVSVSTATCRDCRDVWEPAWVSQLKISDDWWHKMTFRPTSCKSSLRCVECRMISQCHCLTWKLWESEPGMVWVWEWIWKKKSISCNLEVKRLKLHWK